MVSIRTATHADRDDLRRLSERDSAAVPPGALLIAFEDGVLRAAIEPASGTAIADPFVPTAHLVEALRACVGLTSLREPRPRTQEAMGPPGREPTRTPASVLSARQPLTRSMSGS